MGRLLAQRLQRELAIANLLLVSFASKTQCMRDVGYQYMRSTLVRLEAPGTGASGHSGDLGACGRVFVCVCMCVCLPARPGPAAASVSPEEAARSSPQMDGGPDS